MQIGGYIDIPSKWSKSMDTMGTEAVQYTDGSGYIVTLEQLYSGKGQSSCGISSLMQNF